MKDLLLTNWRTSLLAVCLLVALLMFTQGKITAYAFLAIMGFFNVSGYLLARDAAAIDPAPERPAPGSGLHLLREIAFSLIMVLVSILIGLCFWPLVRDAVQPGREFIRPDSAIETEIAPSSLPADHD